MNELHPIVIEILRARNVKTKKDIEAFLNPNFDEHLHNPLLLKDMDQAIRRIKKALNEKQKIVVYGDYDIDGLTATTLLLDYFEQLGAKVGGYIPDRFEEGYGVNTEALKKLKKNSADLIITVDCGSKSFEALEWAHKNKLDVIVTDHHEVGDKLPPCVALVNHKRDDNEYPFRDLAGCGVAFKLVQALQLKLPKELRLTHGREKWLLDLVAMGTVCDVVSLTGENRVLVKYGLQVLSKTPRLGIRALAAVGRVKLEELDTYHLGFVLGPRLNAAGRVEHAQKGLDLLRATDKDKALTLALELDALNTARRTEQDKIYRSAVRQAEEYTDNPVLVLAGEDWSHGVVGIVASKIMERFKKPTLILQIMGDEAKGSARSFGDFNMVAALDSTKDLLLKHGGHFFAAGCTLETQNIDALRQQLNKFYKEQKLKAQFERLDVTEDALINEPEQFNWELHSQLQQLAPFGMGNKQPILSVDSIEVSEVRFVGVDGKHLKLKLKGQSKPIDGIGFGLGETNRELKAKQKVKIWAELAENNYNGSRSLQLIVRKLVILG